MTTVKLKPKEDAFTIKWDVKETTKLERGQLKITDGKGKIVVQVPLDKGRIDAKEHKWEKGEYAKGVKNSKAKDTDPEDKVYEAIPEDMPYRVEIQAHTLEGEPDGLAVAAMHSEVRLYSHNKLYAPKDLRYDPWKSKPCLQLSKGDLLPPGSDDPAEGDTKWYRWELAEYGYHPGPVTDAAAADDPYKISIKEFKRSVPADGGAGDTNFTRLAVSEAEDEATKTAINTIRETDKRALFVDPSSVASNDDDPDMSDGDVKEKLRKPEEGIIVWVDDRQYYTAASGTAKDENDANFLDGDFGLGDYRGGMVNADGRVDTDADAIPRPWIPLKAELRLLDREDKLWDDHDEAKVFLDDDKEKREAMQRALGPLRVDWTLDEVGLDVSPIDLGVGTHVKEFIRSRYYVAWQLLDKKGEHTRKDTEKDVLYTNCADTLGGSRPADLADYSKEHFGLDKLGLAPWKALAESSTESAVTVLHDHIAEAQEAKKDLFEDLIGAAGVYFNPSRIAGDGYRIRAAVHFEETSDYKFKNLEALAARYPAPPEAFSFVPSVDDQGHTAEEWAIPRTALARPVVASIFKDRIVARRLSPDSSDVVLEEQATGASHLRVLVAEGEAWAIWADPAKGIQYRRIP